MKTYVAKPQTVKRDWCLVDATDKTLGRLAAEIAIRLRLTRDHYIKHISDPRIQTQ